MEIKGKDWWLYLKSKYTGYSMIVEPPESILKEILNFNISYENITFEYYNWFRYLNGEHPLDCYHMTSKDGWEMYIKDTFDKYYDMKIFLKENKCQM